MSNVTLDGFRGQLAQAVADLVPSFTDYPVVVEYDNRVVVNPLTQVDPFLCVEVKIVDAMQADLSEKPFHRVIGFLILTAKDKEGNGYARSLKLLEHFYPKLMGRKIGDVHLEFAKLVSPKTVGKWFGTSAMIPFRVDKTY